MNYEKYFSFYLTTRIILWVFKVNKVNIFFIYFCVWNKNYRNFRKTNGESLLLNETYDRKFLNYFNVVQGVQK